MHGPIKKVKNLHVLTPGEESERLTVTVCSNVAGQFLPSAPIFKVLNKKQEFRDGLPLTVRFLREPEIVGHLYQHVQERRRKFKFFSSPCISETFISETMLHTAQ